jgi:hypothetical protein
MPHEGGVSPDRLNARSREVTSGANHIARQYFPHPDQLGDAMQWRQRPGRHVDRRFTRGLAAWRASVEPVAAPAHDRGMSMIAGMPAHPLLVHAIVVLAPLTALLEILRGFWSAARQRLVWLVLALVAVTTARTPITTEAGEWLYNQQAQPSAILQTHAARGAWMIYFSFALLVVAIALAVLHWLAGRSDRRRTVATVVVAIAALVVGVSSIVGVIRIGDAGAEAVWGRQG